MRGKRGFAVDERVWRAKLAERRAAKAALRVVDDMSEPRHRQGRGVLEGPLQEARYPTVDGVRGDWLDDDGEVLPQYRKTVSELRERREMSDIRECALSALANSGKRNE